MSFARELTDADILRVASWGEAPPSRGALQPRGPHEEAFVRCDGLGPVALLRGSRVEDEAELHLLWTRPDARRRGWGAGLLAWWLACLDHAGIKRVLLEVRADNEAAARLYAGFGFDEVGRRPGYYEGVDARVLARGESPCEGRGDES